MSVNSVLAEVGKRWFLLGIVVVISLAKLSPSIGAKGGYLHPEYTVKYIAVSLIFFNSGLSLKAEELRRALGQVKLHVFIQTYTLVFIPIVMTVLVKLLGQTQFIDEPFLDGFQVVGCMPPPVSSAVILTKAVGGNDAAAVFNSAFGSFLGILVTPLLLLTLIGTTANVPFLLVFTQLSVTVVVPLIVGQIVRNFVKSWLEEKSPPFGTISSSVLLFIIYTTFCDTFKSSNSAFSAVSVIQVVVLVVLCQLAFITIAYLLSSLAGVFSRSDIIAVLFCSTHKSLTLGIPMLKIIFGDVDNISSLSLPLLVYHPTQILLGGVLVPWLQNWVKNNPSEQSSLNTIPPESNSPV